MERVVLSHGIFQFLSNVRVVNVDFDHLPVNLEVVVNTLHGLFTVELEAGSLTSEVQELGDMAHHHMDLRHDGDPQVLKL